MKPPKQLLTMCSVLSITALLVACTAPAVAPPATPVPAAATPTLVSPTATLAPTLVPPTATLAPTVSVVPTATVQAPPATVEKAGLDAATVAEIEAMVEKTMTENKIPGYALGIVKGGKIVYTKGFGVERIGGDKPVTPHTVFGTGSVGKTATATAVMQLVAEGKIDLDAPVTGYLPYFKLADARDKDITARHLITHRSGLPADPADWLPLPVEYDDGALERYVRSLEQVRLQFAPGKFWSYSNVGFTVLADIVAKVSGQTFEEYLQEHIVDPLGMGDTLLVVLEADQEQVASPHVRNDSGEVAVSDIFFYRRQYAPAGPLTSSITDVARFAAAHLNRGEFEGTRILPAATYDAMWEPISDLELSLGPVIKPLYDQFGMGWAMGEIDGHRIVQLMGYDIGYSAVLLLAPDDNVALVQSSNYFDEEEFNLSAAEAAIKAMQMILTEAQ